MKRTKGFTLIELLVVIAIIGVLSSVVMSSLNIARAKAADAAIKTDLVGLMGQAEIQYNSFGCFHDGTITCSATEPAVVTGVCPTSGTGNIFTDSVVARQIAHATNAGGGLNSCAETVGGSAWAVVVQLKTDAKSAWCVDSTSAVKLISDAADYTQATLDAAIAGGVCN